MQWETGRAAVTKVTIGSRERLALLRVHGDVLALHTMYWPDQLRSADELPRPGPEVTVHSGEVAMAVSLMEVMSAGFDLAAEHDYAAALRRLAEAKIQHLPAPECSGPGADRGCGHHRPDGRLEGRHRPAPSPAA
jgi:DNA end-binding protein Ku